MSKESIILEYGDIIQIESEKNSDIHNKIFLVDYIDEKRIQLLNHELESLFELPIEDGVIRDRKVDTITILNKSSQKGYARNNHLLPNQWIQIHLGGDVPTILVGQITDLEEDQIEVEVFPTNEKIYIDFAYKGIPKDIPIEKIELREKPVIEEEERTEETPIQEEEEVVVEDDGIPLRQKIQNVIDQSDEFFISDEVDEIQQEVHVSEEEKRYSLEEQMSDLLDELLTKIPTLERTPATMNKLHRIIERFKRLRSEFSTKEKNVIQDYLKRGSNHRPLVDKLFHMKDIPDWVVPVVKHKRNIYLDMEERQMNIHDDMDMKSLTTVRTEEADIINKYYGNDVPSSMNKYDFLERSLTPYFIPHTTPDNVKDLIVVKKTNQNLETVSNNIEGHLKEFFSSVFHRAQIRKQRFVIEKYNMGTSRLQSLPKGTHGFQLELQLTGNQLRKKITEAENVPIESILFLHKPFIQYSMRRLPRALLIHKAHLNKLPILKSHFLHRNTPLNTVMIEKFNPSGTRLNNVFAVKTHIKPHSDVLEVEPSDDVYKQFLETVVPTTKDILETYDIDPSKKLSLQSTLLELEPFSLDIDTVHHKDYKTIVSHIEKNIKKVKSDISNHFQHIHQFLKLNLRNTYFKSYIHNIVGDTKSLSLYQPRENAFHGEHFIPWMNTDYGKYIYTIISKKNDGLYSMEKLDQDIIERLNTMHETLDNVENKCLNYVLSKKYDTIEQLNQDNNVNIYYDKEYDTTDYSYIDKFKDDYENMEFNEYREYVVEQIMYDKNISYESAIIEFTSMYEGRRPVEEGVYAVLLDNSEETPNPYYYKRVNNRWELDQDIQNAGYKSSQLFCNLQENCVQSSIGCNEFDLEKKNLEYGTLEGMIQDLSEEFLSTQRERIQRLKDTISYLNQRLHNIQRLNYEVHTRENKQQYALGQKLEELDVVYSPHQKLVNLILAQPDFIQKMTNIHRFIELNYVRSPNVEEDESPYWLYCVETNTKLLPSFYKDLSEAFLFHHNYTETLHRICAEQGEISDDGDKWVDKYSGYTIRLIDFDIDEGFTADGFRIETREVMREEESVLTDEVTQEDKLINSKDGIIIRKIVTSLSQHIGVQLLHRVDFIIKKTLKYVHVSLGTEENYNRRKERVEEKTGKKMIPYEDKKGELMMLFVILFFLLSIQVNIPSIRTKKTFPGCVRSFAGFPLEESENDAGLHYIVCVSKKLVSNEFPWNKIRRFKEDILKKNIITLYNKLIIKDTDVQSLIQDKITHRREKGEDIEDTLEKYRSWREFRPPLQHFTLKKVHRLSDNFKNKLVKYMEAGNPKQEEKIQTLRSRISLLSLSLLKSIREVVNKENLLLQTNAGILFRENACCSLHTTSRENMIDYFTDKSEEIEKTREKIGTLEKMYYDIMSLTIPDTIINTKNTRRVYEIGEGSTHSEETIYQAFIKYCKYNKNLPIHPKILSVCVHNESSFSDLHTLREKIEIMKEEGIEYTTEMFYSLLNVLNKHNIIKVEYASRRNRKQLYYLQKYLKHLDKKDIKRYSAIQKYLNSILEYFYYVNEGLREGDIDTSTDIMINNKQFVDKQRNKLRNHLLKHIERDTERIKKYLFSHSNMKKHRKRKVEEYLTSFIEFKPLTSSELRSSEDNTVSKARSFVMNMVYQMVYDFPNMILNNIRYDILKIPAHWGLSGVHKSDIKDFLKNSFQPLVPFVGEENIHPILRNIRQRMEVIIQIVERIPHMNKNKKREPVFNHEIIKELCHYLYLRVFIEYIDVVDQYINDATMLKELEGVTVGEEENEEESAASLLEGDKLKIQRRIGDLLVAFLEMGMTQKKRIDLNQETITELTLRSREKEKDIKTTKLKDLSPEERNVDNVLKAAKMGRWNIGLQKGLTQYVQETYDMERSSDEYREIVNLEMQYMGDDRIVPQNENIIRDEIMDQEVTDFLIELDAYDMSHLPDDDDFGEMDGDEFF